ncbi:hypothetical protein PM082_006880 [Marasmius tenuissimus]|nr:hypothetical protein PM082_006880 [Marasmius tenuissimus]
MGICHRLFRRSVLAIQWPLQLWAQLHMDKCAWDARVYTHSARISVPARSLDGLSIPSTFPLPCQPLTPFSKGILPKM